MQGGKVFIADQQFQAIFNVLQNTASYNHSLVYHFDEKSCFFMDIDSMANKALDDILLKVVDILNQRFELELTKENLFVTKNQSSEKYHVYCQDIVLTRHVLKSIFEQLNADIGAPIADTNCSSLRIDGFNKFDRTTGTFSDNTRYLPLIGDIDIDFFNKTCLFADTKQLTQLRNPLLNVRHAHNLNFSRDDDSVSNSVHNNDDNSEESDQKSQSESVDYSQIRSVDDIVEAFPWSKPYFQGHTVRKIKVSNKSSHIFVDLSKSDNDRLCPFEKRTHRYVNWNIIV